MMRIKFMLPLLAAMTIATTAQAKTLVFCSEGSPEGFDPGIYTTGTTFDVSSRSVFSQLVEFERGTTNIVPGLAESWTISSDGKEYTFKLRKGVKFHTVEGFKPTRDFNADDVVFSLMRQKDKSNPWYSYAPGTTWDYFDSMSLPEFLKNVEKVDDYTVKIVLTQPQSPMLANLGMGFASILSAEFAEKLKAEGKMEQLNQVPVGTGPFQFVGYQKDAVVRFAANPNYWEGKAPIDNLIFAITPDASVRYQKLKAGECQVMAYPNPADLPTMKADPKLQVLEQEGLNVGYFAYNTTQAPFDNVKVRKALNMAINKESILAAVYQGAGKIAKNPIPPTIWSYNDATVDDKYDPEAAKKLLAEAGVKDLKMKVWAMPVQRPYNPNARRMAELIQADFAKVGVTVEIVSYEWGEYLKLLKNKDHDGAVLLGWTGDNGDPDNFLAVLLGCDGVGTSNNVSEWCYKPFEDLIQKAKIVSDKAERTKLYEQAQVIFKEQAPWATIAHSVRFQPLAKSVKNFKIDPFGGHIFYGVDLAE
jgi:dipeptide transport system substrate-binding protein